ncbi:YqzE family protein [Microaerobacter geothermalis]|uniref:YqzE family protein n=1 Tax=Microaerobacter geothermalis TaxID=674972 RepID=UPI001F28F0AC|nr:YqzE family protein [Microaerobacter geothermalis]MCF6094204.1 YqzE family protein [Microaerobacter geothermalis]
MSSNDLVKYLTVEMVRFLEKPRKENKREEVKIRENWSSRWFGLIPFSLKMWMKR